MGKLTVSINEIIRKVVNVLPLETPRSLSGYILKLHIYSNSGNYVSHDVNRLEQLWFPFSRKWVKVLYASLSI